MPRHLQDPDPRRIRDREAFIAQFDYLRKLADYSQRRLARILGWHPNNIAQICKSGSMMAYDLPRFSEILHCPILAFFSTTAAGMSTQNPRRSVNWPLQDRFHQLLPVEQDLIMATMDHLIASRHGGSTNGTQHS